MMKAHEHIRTNTDLFCHRDVWSLFPKELYGDWHERTNTLRPRRNGQRFADVLSSMKMFQLQNVTGPLGKIAVPNNCDILRHRHTHRQTDRYTHRHTHTHTKAKAMIKRFPLCQTYKLILVIDGSNCPQMNVIGFTGNTITLVEAVASCRQVLRRYLSHCRPRSISAYCKARSQNVENPLGLRLNTPVFKFRNNRRGRNVSRVLQTILTSDLSMYV